MNGYDPLDIQAQEKTQKEQALRTKIESTNEEADLKWLMGSRRGRRIVWRILEQSGVFRLSFNTNAMQMAFNEGSRNYGNRTLAMLQTVCPELYLQMTKEATDVRNTDDRKSN